MAREARQFNGTLGNAKELVAWIGAARSCCGATHGFEDHQEGGLNLTEPVTYVDQASGETRQGLNHVDVPAGSWVVKDGDVLTIFSDAQFRVAFPNGVA